MVCRWIWLENSRNNFANPLPSFISCQVSELLFELLIIAEKVAKTNQF